MELFHRRYLCFFSFVFLFTSSSATLLSGITKMTLIFAFLLPLVLLGLLLIFTKRYRFKIAVSFFSFLFAFVAIFNSFFFITLPQSKAKSYVSEASVAQVRVISCERADENHSEYIARIEKIGNKNVNIKSYIYCDFNPELDYGDKMVGTFNVSEPSGYESEQKDILLVLDAVGDYPILYKNTTNANYFSLDGVIRICQSIRNVFKAYVDSIFGEASALVKGFLIDDREDISIAVQNDFKRTGTTHLLAVSGLHITLLLGSFEILLRKLYVIKWIRCAIVSVAALFLLVLTNFSGSAVRAVFMLYAVYLSYMFFEDHDTITSLFVSVFLITLISPLSVYDIGMWMSFFATLGLVSVYAYIDTRLPKINTDNVLKRIPLKLCLGVVKAVLITLVANFFLIPIMWIFFGEISLVSIPANLLLSPITTLFLPFCAIGVILGGIPLLNSVIVYTTELFEGVIIGLADMFADIKGATLSLQYPFVAWIVNLFVILMSILLVIKLKNKLIICVPPILLVLSFCVCLAVFNIKSQPNMRYEELSEAGMLFFDDGSKSSVCDITSGGYTARQLFLAHKNPYATEIEHYVITSPSENHVYLLEIVLTTVHIRKLYIPISENDEELVCASEIYSTAKEYDIDVVFYEDEGGIEFFGRLTIE